MVSIIIGCVPIHGHVQPLLALARHLVSRGDRVRFLTGSRFTDAVSLTGAEFVPLPPSADFDDREITTRFPELAHLSPMRGVGFYVEHVFTRPAIPQYAAIEAMLRAEPADAIVTEPTFGAGAAISLLPATDRPPLVVAGVIPLGLPGPDLAPFGFGVTPMRGILGRLRNRSMRALSEHLVMRGVRRASDEVRRATVGLPQTGTNRSSTGWVGRADAVAQFTTPSFEYPRRNLPTRLTFTGPISGSGTEIYPRPDWWEDLEGSRAVFDVTQGTLANTDLTELVLPTIAALADEPVLVIVSTGGARVAPLQQMPTNVRLADFLPYDDLLPHTDVFITNGGYGGTQFALRYGVPIVIAPGSEDKSEVAARVEWSGVGVRLGTRRPTPQHIRAGVRAAMSQATYRERARAIAGEIAESPGVAGVADVVDDAIRRHPSHRRVLPTPANGRLLETILQP
ncbi:glycosyltransferase [Microbacterium sp. SS28]|uniref:glycosyltransferase n=1 Tax=Microbacterium sp. SS28 TaxID=2919948 RepID=UPI001FA9D6FA|nr:nucleotide disphospho-sugar-binding domain-containing protein [Microbacterium sp. SS28]